MGAIFSAIALVFMINLVMGQTQFNVCCEKTQAGAWCQNSLEENCDADFRKTPTSCESTSFCKLGCCLDTDEGLCMENTPQKVCEEQEGTWVDDAQCNVRQCDLGCCVLGTQASFVTQTRCKKLSGFFGLQTDFRTNVADELTCIAIAASQDQGACVFESDYQRTCRFTTRGECLGLEQGGNQTSSGEFFKDYLCSADDLATNCGPTRETMCVDGKNEVYFKDTCGNKANIYDADKIYEKDAAYWQKVVAKSDSCGFGDDKGNAGSRSCGNCEYFQGSICSKGTATYGDYACNDLNCYNTENGNDYKNGESWCMYQGNVGEGVDAVGSRHFRHICFNGEELVEPCDDYRAKVCIESEVTFGGSSFIEAGCRVNRWQTCMLQDEEDDCLNTDRRDCFWMEGAQFIGLEQTSSVSSQSSSSSSDSSAFGATTQTFGTTGNVISPITGFASKENEEESSGVQLGGNACVPNTPPGLKFWQDSDAQGICEIGNSVCIVEYSSKIFGSEKCEENCECLTEAYAQTMNKVCTSLGDCGAYVNIANRFTDDGAKWSGGSLSQGIMNEAKERAGVK